MNKGKHKIIRHLNDRHFVKAHNMQILVCVNITLAVSARGGIIYHNRISHYIKHTNHQTCQHWIFAGNKQHIPACEQHSSKSQCDYNEIGLCTTKKNWCLTRHLTEDRLVGFRRREKYDFFVGSCLSVCPYSIIHHRQHLPASFISIFCANFEG